MESSANEENTWLLEKVAVFHKDQWTDFEYQETILLKIRFDMLFIVTENLVLYRLKLTNEMKAFSNENIIIIVFETQEILNKIKMKINDANRSTEILNLLALYLPIEIQNPNPESPNEMLNFQELFKQELERRTNFQNNVFPFPPGFQFQEFIKMCILDPNFPDMVDQVEKALHQYLH